MPKKFLLIALLAGGMALLGGRVQAHKQPHSPEELKLFEEQRMEYVLIGDAIWHGEPQSVFRPDLKAPSLGSPIGLACAMCHPDASNTHPETFPKFMFTLAKFATLAEQINWCITRPLQAKAIPLDSEEMKALLAFIMHNHKGVPIDPGRH